MNNPIFRSIIAAFAFSLMPSLSAAAPPAMTVYKSPSCSCCAAWVEYIRGHGFEVVVKSPKDLSGIKRKYGVKPQLASCHTAVIDGYVIEGHVPVNDIRQVLRDRPDLVGLTAPGMPQLSPGMHSIEPKDYDVLSFDKNGKVRVFSRY
jgi:hypothetical protein